VPVNRADDSGHEPVCVSNVLALRERAFAGDVYAVVHLQRDVDAHHLWVDWPEARLGTHAARPR
jgi:hypothetical protein